MTINQVSNDFEYAIDRIWDYKDKCYGDKSNDTFDAIHDDLHYQLEGLQELYNDWENDKLNDSLNEEDIFHYSCELRDVREMIVQIDSFYQRVVITKENNEINWVYG